MRRRVFIFGAAGTVLVAASRISRAQTQSQSARAAGSSMDDGAVRPVRRPPKPGATPTLDDDGIKALERGLSCQCGSCGLDVFTCRTTDFTCQVSPAMHRDVLGLVNGGYNADEIMLAFVDVYGEKARMAPKAEGFNIVAYVAPFATILGAAVFAGVWIARNLKRQAAGGTVPEPEVGTTASAEEIERIERAMRDDSR